MTSKISFIKLFLADIRHRGWLAALASMGLFFGMPFYAILYVDSRFSTVMQAEAGKAVDGDMLYAVEQLRNVFPGLINGYTFQYLAAAIAVLAVLCALTGFGYVHSRDKLDFYHALPVKRGQWFAVRYVSGVLIFLVPYVICSGLVIAVGGVNGIMTVQTAGECAAASAGGILAFLLIYNTCILAAMLTGQTVTGLLASAVIAVYPAIVFGLFSVLKGTFFETYTGTVSGLSDMLAELLSPAGLFVSLISAAGARTGAGTFIAAAVIAVLLLAGAFLLYRIYPSEAAGNSLAFRRTAPVFKVMICIPAALFSSYIAQAFTGITGEKWIIVLSMVAAVTLAAVIELIYQQDLRLLLKGWLSSLISVAGVAVILCIFGLDLTGYDTWMPEKEKIEAVSFRPHSFLSYFEYPEDYTVHEADSVMISAGTGETAAEELYRLAQKGVENLQAGYTPVELDLADSDSEIAKECENALFCFEMQNGKKVYRRYCLKKEDLSAALDELGQSEEFRKELFPVFHLDESQAESALLRDVYGPESAADFTGDQLRALLNAYKKDVLEADMDVFAEGEPVGELMLDVSFGDRDDTVTMGSFYIYREYSNTIAFIEGSGYTFREELPPEEVLTVMFHLTGETVRSGKYDKLLSAFSPKAERTDYEDMSADISISSPEDISIALKHLKPYIGGILGHREWTGDYADIQFTEGMGSYSYLIE